MPFESTEDHNTFEKKNNGTVLVTGASGLLGRELVAQLVQSNQKVVALYHRHPLNTNGNPNLKSLSCDLLDVIALESCLEGVSEIYHCAGLVSFTPKTKNRLFKVNVEGTANLVNAALAAGVRKIVHVSSVAALGRIRDGEWVTEKMQWSPESSNSIYGHSKYLGEMELWRGMAEGLDVVVVNPSIILGAGDWNDGSTAIFKSVFKSFPWYTEGTTGFVDVRDAATAMILLMKSEVTNERFILSAENAAYREAFDQMADAFKKKRPFKKVTPFLASLIWRFEYVKSLFTGTEPLVTKETAATALAQVRYDNRKFLIQFPGFQYRPLSETIRETCDALQQKLNKH